ncbi:MAG: acyltransferase, partial [Sideroxydans sp.]|nr:acyltransferase [Sideroxydans sp.]
HNAHPIYRPDIDGLRAIAILSVVIFHAFPARLTGGFVGVDIFFVISGFLISSIIFRSMQRGDFSFSEFFAHRIKRIFPALILVLIACFIFGWFALLPDEFKQLGKHIAAGSGFVQNVVLWKEAGYFDTTSELKPLMHLWSLAIEEQFYLLYPLLIWGAWRMGLNVLTIVVLIGLTSLLLNIHWVEKDAIKTFFLPQTRFWELLAGALLAYLQLFKRVQFAEALRGVLFHPAIFSHPPIATKRKVWTNNVLAFIGITLIVLAVFGLNKEKLFPGWWALLPVLGAAMLILSGPDTWVNRAVLANKVMVFIGLISYPLYLWHWPLLSFAHIIESGTPSREIRIGIVLLSILLAWLTYRFFEKPIRFGKNTWIKTATLTVLMAVVGFVGFNTFQRDGLRFRSMVKDSLKINAQFEGALWKYTKNEICLKNYPFADSENFQWWFCMQSKEASPTVLLLGNSFSNQLYPGLVLNEELRHHVVLSIGTCDPAFQTDTNPKFPCFGDRQERQREFINKIIATDKELKYVILAGLQRNADEKYILALNNRIKYIQARGKKVILFNPHIQPGFEPKACFSRPFAKPKDCSFLKQNRDELDSNFHLLTKRLNEINSGILFFDQNDIYCTNSTCSYIKDGLPLFRDAGHISEFASIEVGNRFVDWLKLNEPNFLVH